MDGILLDLINVQLLAAGFLGGLVHAFRIEKATPWGIIRSIIVGGLAANFIAPQLLKILTMLPSGFIAFGVGMSGKHICYYVEKAFSSLDFLGKTKNE